MFYVSRRGTGVPRLCQLIISFAPPQTVLGLARAHHTSTQLHENGQTQKKLNVLKQMHLCQRKADERLTGQRTARDL